MAVLGFGEWLPDLPPLENTGAIYVNNVVPTAGMRSRLSTLMRPLSVVRAQSQLGLIMERSQPSQVVGQNYP
jgi:hypothetical protein